MLFSLNIFFRGANSGGTGSGSGSFSGYKGSSGVATPGSVHRGTNAGVDCPPASVESPASVTPSPLPTPRTPHSQPTSVNQHQGKSIIIINMFKEINCAIFCIDPSMPLLSPHQPPSNASVGDPTTPAPADAMDTKSAPDALGPKSVSSLNQVRIKSE